MSLNSVLLMLLGAALVSVGVLAAALADRIRGLRASREPAPRDRASRTAVPVVESADLLRAPPTKQPRPPRAETKVAVGTSGDDVIAALVAAGYKKPVATEAAWACAAGERTTIEGWTAASLRRCARRGMS